MRLSFGKAAVWFGVTVASAVMAFAAVQNVDLPDGPGKKVLESSCTNCHDLKELNKFKGIYKSKEWNELVMNMIGYGAKVPDDQVPVLVDYLAKNFGPKDAAAGNNAAAANNNAAANSNAGKNILENSCTNCHGIDVVEQHGLTADGWTDIVRGMIGFGATVTDEQVPILVDYLAKTYGPKK